MIRRPYRTQARFFRDSDARNTIHWYPVPESAEPLGIVSPIASLDWMRADWSKDGVGEVFNEPRVFDGWNRIAVVPAGDPCGAEDDFRHGGTYRPDLPPVARDADGIMHCCRPPLGGLVWSGTGAVRPGGMVWGQQLIYVTFPGNWFAAPLDWDIPFDPLGWVWIYSGGRPAGSSAVAGFVAPTGGRVRVRFVNTGAPGNWAVRWVSAFGIQWDQATGFGGVFESNVPPGVFKAYLVFEATAHTGTGHAEFNVQHLPALP